MLSLELRRPVRARPSASAGYRRTLVPVSDGPGGELAVDLACRFAGDKHAVLVALAPIEIPLEMPLDVPAREEEARAHMLLERALAIGASYGVRVVPRTGALLSRSDDYKTYATTLCKRKARKFPYFLSNLLDEVSCGRGSVSLTDRFR